MDLRAETHGDEVVFKLETTEEEVPPIPTEIKVEEEVPSIPTEVEEEEVPPIPKEIEEEVPPVLTEIKEEASEDYIVTESIIAPVV